jgi:hypothetical protein
VLVDSNFGHARFDRTLIPYKDMEPSFPPLANVCRDMSARLAVQASMLGQNSDARLYRLTSIAKGEEALWRAWRASDKYSEDHYPTSVDRVGALLQWVLSKVNGLLWGYGESMRRLLFNVFLLGVVICPILFLLTTDDLRSSPAVTTGDAWLLSLGSILSNSGSTGITAVGVAELVVLVESALGFLFFGLFVTYLFRAVTRR